MMLTHKIFLYGCLILCPTLVVYASDGGVHAQEEEWQPLSAGPVTTWTAPTIEQGKLALQPFFYYNHTRGSFNEDGNYEKLPAGDKTEQYQQSLFLEYGITQRLAFAAQGFYEENSTRQSGEKASNQGWADTYLDLKYSLLKENSWRPAVSGLFQVKVPSGKYQNTNSDKLGTDLHGDGSYDHGYGLILTKKFKPFVVHADAIYSFPLERRIDGIETRQGRYLNGDVAVEYFLPKGFNLDLEANGYWQRDRKEDGDYIPSSDNSYVIVSPGIGWSNEAIQTLLAYQRTISGVNNDAVDGAVLTFYYEF